MNGDTSFITVTYGEDVQEETAEELAERLRNKYGERIEVMCVDGGQPVYYYMIAVE